MVLDRLNKIMYSVDYIAAGMIGRPDAAPFYLEHFLLIVTCQMTSMGGSHIFYMTPGP